MPKISATRMLRCRVDRGCEIPHAGPGHPVRYREHNVDWQHQRQRQHRRAEPGPSTVLRSRLLKVSATKRAKGPSKRVGPLLGNALMVDHWRNLTASGHATPLHVPFPPSGRAPPPIVVQLEAQFGTTTPERCFASGVPVAVSTPHILRASTRLLYIHG